MKADEEDIAADAVGTTRVGYVWRGVSGFLLLHLRKASRRDVTVFSQLPLSSGRLPEVLVGVFGIDGLVVRCPTDWARRELVHTILDCRLGVQLFGSARVAHLVGALSQLDEPYRLQANGTFAHAGPVHRASRSHRHRAER